MASALIVTKFITNFKNLETFPWNFFELEFWVVSQGLLSPDLRLNPTQRKVRSF